MAKKRTFMSGHGLSLFHHTEQDCKGHLDHIIQRHQITDRTAAAAALAHLNRDLAQPKTQTFGSHNGFRLRKIRRVVRGEGRNSPAIEGAESRRGVRDFIASQKTDETGEEMNPDPPDRGGLIP